MRSARSWVLRGDVRESLAKLPTGKLQTVVTSPPYWGLRSYLPADYPDKVSEIGTEKTPQEYVENLVGIFREVRRVLRDDGTLWLNLGDCYAGGSDRNRNGIGSAINPSEKRDGSHRINKHCKLHGLKPKDLVGIPWSVALALRADGWWLRSDIVWAKGTSGQKSMKEEAAAAMLAEGVAPEVVERVLARWEPYVGNCMPSSVEDRPTSSHEYVFLLAKREKYFYDHVAVREAYSGKRSGNGYKRPERLSYRNADGSPRGNDHRFLPGSGRNLRTVWTIPTQPFPGAHFATFPERLVEPCILAGSSEGGCCARCGAPRTRVVDRVVPTDPGRGESKLRDAEGLSAGAASTAKRQLGGNYQKQLNENPIVTLGWEPSCSCAAGFQPCLVLDPFCGSGTVGVVATREGRDFVGIELSPENVEMAKQRITDPDYARKVRKAQRDARAKTP